MADWFAELNDLSAVAQDIPGIGSLFQSLGAGSETPSAARHVVHAEGDSGSTPTKDGPFNVVQQELVGLIQQFLQSNENPTAESLTRLLHQQPWITSVASSFENNVLEFSLVYSTTAFLQVPFDLRAQLEDLGLAVNAAGSLDLGGSLDVGLTFGIDLNDGVDAASAFYIMPGDIVLRAQH